MNFKQSFKLAIKSIKSNKIRSFLTMLGIIIGVASVIVLISLVEGMAQDMVSQFEGMGTNLITANVNGRGGNRAVTVDQMETLIEENSDIISYMSPVVNGTATVKVGSTSLESTTITGVGEDYDQIKGVEVDEGRFIGYIDIERHQKVCVIGSYIAKELYDGEDPLGQSIKLSGSNYTIIGVLTETADSEADGDDDIIYSPYSSATKLSRNGTISSYVFGASDTTTVDQAKAAVEDELYSVYEDEDAYRVISQAEMIETIDEMLATVSTVLIGIAGISLLVGGIGIMNIMLVSVIERTREIGIRKSLGAKRKDIMGQFVIEASTTSAVGGIIGIALGIGLAYAAGALLDMTVAPTFQAVLLAFSVSVVIGITFGYFPADKASKLNPIDALRHE